MKASELALKRANLKAMAAKAIAMRAGAVWDQQVWTDWLSSVNDPETVLAILSDLPVTPVDEAAEPVADVPKFHFGGNITVKMTSDPFKVLAQKLDEFQVATAKSTQTKKLGSKHFHIAKTSFSAAQQAVSALLDLVADLVPSELWDDVKSGIKPEATEFVEQVIKEQIALSKAKNPDGSWAGKVVGVDPGDGTVVTGNPDGTISKGSSYSEQLKAWIKYGQMKGVSVAAPGTSLHGGDVAMDFKDVSPEVFNLITGQKPAKSNYLCCEMSWHQSIITDSLYIKVCSKPKGHVGTHAFTKINAISSIQMVLYSKVEKQEVLDTALQQWMKTSEFHDLNAAAKQEYQDNKALNFAKYYGAGIWTQVEKTVCGKLQFYIESFENQYTVYECQGPADHPGDCNHIKILTFTEQWIWHQKQAWQVSEMLASKIYEVSLAKNQEQIVQAVKCFTKELYKTSSKPKSKDNLDEFSALLKDL